MGLRNKETEQEKLDKRFLNACESNDAAAAALFLASGADIGVKDERGWPPLFAAIFYGRIATANMLMEKDIDVNEALSGPVHSSYILPGTPLLLVACARGHEAFAQRLVELGAAVNVEDANHTTPLHSAATQGWFHLAQALTDRGADTEALDKNGNTPEMLAAAKNQHGVEKLLRDLRESKTPAPEVPAAAVITEDWVLSAPEEVACVAERPAFGYKLTEVFNFEKRTYTHITRDLETAAQSVSHRFFDECPDKKILEDAHAELEKQGGTADKSVIYGARLQKGPV